VSDEMEIVEEIQKYEVDNNEDEFEDYEQINLDLSKIDEF
jgi:hypothetical protein